jgi:ribosomal protein S18 acetylase RimI-like enzyme
MKITVREYKDSDYAACRSLWGELTIHEADLYEDDDIVGNDPGRGFDEFLNRADRIGMWVAEDGGKNVGFAGLLDTVGEEEVAEIEPVVVSASFRSEGVGTKLIRRAIKEAKTKGFRYLTIHPGMRNEKAFNLYVRLGFNLVGSIELFQELSPKKGNKWKPGMVIHGKELSY